MRKLRVALRLTLLVVVTALLYLLKIAGAPLRLVSSSWHRTWRDWMFYVWARAVTRLIGMRVSVTGMAPERPFFLVTNHLGYIDIILLASFVRAVFVAKSEIAGWPVVGRLVASVDTIFIQRENKRNLLDVNAAIETALDAGEGIVLFPEGTSTNGAEVLALRPSLLAVPAGRNYPVCYAAITYTTPDGEPPAADSVCWWGDDAFVPHLLRLLELRHFVATLSFGAEPIVAQDRKRLAVALREGIVSARELGGIDARTG